MSSTASIFRGKLLFVMKGRFLQAIAVVVLTISGAQAALWDVDITATRLKSDQEKSRESNVTITTKEIVYKVTVQSRSFKPITDLQVKYMIFYADVQPGAAGKPVETSHRGVETFSALDANKLITFDTKPLKLSVAELDSGWYYTSGAGSRARDRVTGVWIRAYSNGKLIGEYTNPSTVGKRDWKE